MRQMLLMMLGLAQAGDVWLVVDEPDRHLAVPTSWLTSDEGKVTLKTRDGELVLDDEVGRLARQAEGAKRSWALQNGSLGLEHRAVADGAVHSVDLGIGNGLRVTVDLGEDTAKLAASSIDADLTVDGLHLTLHDDDLLAPLRRSTPTVLYSGTNAKGKRVHIELK
ncbi:MAG: hypothetical protein R3F61_22440 [Myxococcota bacterium]